MNFYTVEVELPSYPIKTSKEDIENEFRQILEKVENCLGIRDTSYKSFKIEFDNNDPRISNINQKNKEITICLTTTSLNDNWQLKYQLAHEAVHCLNPLDLEKATVLEEGIATDFSEVYVDSINTTCPISNYRNALKKFNMLGDKKYEIIKKIRAKNQYKSISEISDRELINEIENDIELSQTIEINDIKELTNKFQYC